MQPKRPAPLAPEPTTHRVPPSMIRGILFEQLRQYVVLKLAEGHTQTELAIMFDLHRSQVAALANANNLSDPVSSISTDRLLRACDRLDHIFIEIVIRGN